MYYVMRLETSPSPCARLVATAETSIEAREAAIAMDTHREGRPAGRTFILDAASYTRWCSWVTARDQSQPRTIGGQPTLLGATD